MGGVDLIPGAVLWGAEWVPLKSATRNFLVVGAPGSGKSLLIKKLLYSSLLGDARERSRYLINDPKGELACFLDHHQLAYTNLNPFLKGSPYWDVSRDVSTFAAAREIAGILIPEARNGDTFWRNAAVEVFSAAMASLSMAGSWTLRDALIATLSPEYLRPLLQRANETTELKKVAGRILTTYIGGEPRTWSNLQMTISAYLSPFEPIAEAWHKAKSSGADSFSIRDWAGGREIVLMSQDEVAYEALRLVNAVIFRLASQVLLSAPDQPTSGSDMAFSWVVLDEVRESGKLDGLGRLLTNGRSKGVVSVLGFQAIEGMRDVYGENLASEMAGMCQNIAVLRLASADTAQWASRMFSSRRLSQWTESKSDSESVTLAQSVSSSSQSSNSRSESIADIPFFEPMRFLYLPECGPTKGLTGFFRFSHVLEEDPVEDNIPWSLIEPYTRACPFMPRERYAGSAISDWSDAERAKYLQGNCADTEVEGGGDNMMLSTIIARRIKARKENKNAF